MLRLIYQFLDLRDDWSESQNVTSDEVHTCEKLQVMWRGLQRGLPPQRVLQTNTEHHILCWWLLINYSILLVDKSIHVVIDIENVSLKTYVVNVNKNIFQTLHSDMHTFYKKMKVLGEKVFIQQPRNLQ